MYLDNLQAPKRQRFIIFLILLSLVQPCICLSMSTSLPANRRIVVVGSANQDLTSYTPTLPTLGQTVMGDTFETSCGGKGANQAVAAASLGLSPVSMVCRVGDDVFGDSLLSNFRRVGVTVDDESTVIKDNGKTSSGVAAIVVDKKSGDNMIIVTPGANHVMSPEDVEKSIRALPEPPAIVIVQLEISPEAALQALKVGREMGAITILNPAPAPETFSLDDFYQYTDIVIPNETELRKIVLGREDADGDELDMAKKLLEKGVRTAVVVTLGARGAMIVSRTKDGNEDPIQDLVEAPADLPCREDPVVDTVGAGDAFCGALATYLSTGMCIVESGCLACGFASMSVRRQGASYPSAAELPECLKIKHMPEESTKPKITFVTGNKNKLEEVKQILSKRGEIPFEVTNKKIDLPELQGDPVEIAAEKCRLAAKKVQGACLTEDTSLCFNALNGMPGPFIKWFLEKCGHDGLNAMLSGFEDKTAYAQTVVAFTTGPGEEVHTFDGRTDGTIVPARGPLDFGWDPIFEPKEGNGKTYAEMDKEEKNDISHRGRSFAKLHSFFLDNASKLKATMK